MALEKLGAVFNQVSTQLQYTPRKFVIHPETTNLIVIETDHNAYTDETKLQRKQQMAEVGIQRDWHIAIFVVIKLFVKYGFKQFKHPNLRALLILVRVFRISAVLSDSPKLLDIIL